MGGKDRKNKQGQKQQSQGQKQKQSNGGKWTNMSKRCKNCGWSNHVRADCTKPKGDQDWEKRDCEMKHAGHKNGQCTNNSKNTDIWAGDGKAKTQSKDDQNNQGKQNRNQKKDSLDFEMENYGIVQLPVQKIVPREGEPKFEPIKFLFCARCNQRGHAAAQCKYDGVTFSTFGCNKCGEPGHLGSECRNLAAIRRKRDSFGALFRGPPPAGHTFKFNAPPLAGFSAPTWGNGQANNVAGMKRKYEPPILDNIRARNQVLEDQNAKRRAKDISDRKWARRNLKCENGVANHLIQARAAWLYDYGNKGPEDCLKPYLPLDIHPELRKFAEEMVNRPHDLWRLCEQIRDGQMTFFRDSDALRAIACREIPFCKGCDANGKGADSQGWYLDWLLKVIPTGSDVLALRDDWDDWGVFVIFGCTCCQDGYEYIHGDGKMDWQKEYDEMDVLV